MELENETPHGTEEHPEEESSIKEVPPQHAITTGSRSDTDILAKEALSDTTAQDNTLVTPMPILPVTPTVHGQSLIEEERSQRYRRKKCPLRHACACTYADIFRCIR